MTYEQTIKTVLETVKCPLTGRSPHALHLHPVIRMEGNTIQLTLVGGFPLGLIEEGLKEEIIEAVKNVQRDLKLLISFEFFVKAHRTQMAGKGLRGVKNAIAVASGKGGVGKSTVTVNLAAALAKAGARVGILDADIYGPSIPTMLGDAPPVEFIDGVYKPVRAHGLDAMSIGYLTDNEGALIWRGPMLAKSLLQMMNMTAWDDLDYLFIDLPPGTGDIQLSLVQKIPLAGAIVVTTPQTVATLDAEKAIQMFDKTGIDTLGVIENMALYHCSHCHHEEAIFGQGGAKLVCEKYNKTLLGQLPLDSHIREEADNGRPAVLKDSPYSLAFQSAAVRLVSHLSSKPINYSDKFPDIVVSTP